MFYSQFILAKKGPLATIWIAAHLERKLRKNQITDTNIGESVDSILYPEVPIALRLSGHLLLGVVRIYSRKVNLLFNDCSDALVKIHQAFQSSAVNLPPGAVVAPFNSITLPESFDFDDLEAHLNRENMAAQIGNSDFEHHVTARDLITLQEQNDDRRLLFTLDERFEDVGNPYAVLDLTLEELAPEKPLCPSVAAHTDRMPVEDDVLPPLPMEDEIDFDGMNIDKDIADTPTVIEPDAGEVAKGVSEATMEVPDVEKLRAARDPGRQEQLMGLQEFDELRETSVSMDVDDRVPSTVHVPDAGITHNLEETPLLREDPTPLRPERSSPVLSPEAFYEDNDALGSILGKRTPKLEVAPTPVSTKRVGKKRKHAFDAIVSLSSADMKKQLKSTSDICRLRRRAPSTEYEIWMSKRDNHIEQSFSEPSFPGLCEEVKTIYESVVNERIRSHQNPPTVEQVSLRRTPRRSVVDAKGKIDDLREVSTEPAAEEVQIEGISLIMPSATEELIENGENVDAITAQHDEVLSPDHELSFEPVQGMAAGDLDVARQQDEGVLNKEQEEGVSNTEQEEEVSIKEGINGAVAKDIRESNDEAAATIDDHYETGGPKPQVLGFLADSRDPDELGNEMAATKQTGKSSSNDNGWSSRSRAVAMYLKEKFETMEPVETSANIRSLKLEKLLTGRTRREAARLFFETLVLGTKGYLQVEQACPFADVQLTATRRLLKAAF
ncbi:hypothetical protein GOP47_0017732 [Adiantum capillus-veneris]|uniref:Uncharacterized protein n=1 Tax=Adiantum capillus-veneris TaxID=13818 RepID=A0A9D4UFY3_ADICA|nr:hypothetical protein GOP47_0017732 [Adiantum capillus-veneris]